MTNPTNTQITHGDGGVAMTNTESQRGQRAAEWVGWHLAELLGVTVPAALAGAVSGWFALASAAVGAGWAAHELRLARRHRALREDHGHREITTGHDDQPDQQEDTDEQDEQTARRMEVGR